MTIARIMRRSFVVADPDETLESARQTMRMAQLRHLLVSRSDRLLGVLSYREILESLLADILDGLAPGGRTVGQAMKLAPAFVTPQTSLVDAADRLCRYGIGCLPVLEASPELSSSEGRLVGVVTEQDLLRAAYGPCSGSAGRTEPKGS